MLRKLKNIFHLLEAVGAAVFFHFPGKKLIIVGITGTDGKTTTTTLIHHILTAAGIKAGLSSTLFSPHMTTPGRWRIQKFLWQSVKNNCTHAVLEVTSIAVDQHRIWGVNFALGVLTNIAGNEHLDYHRSFENYRLTKLKFLQSCPLVILNADNQSVTFLEETLKGKKIIKYKLTDWKKYRFQTSLLGDFNKLNILAAAAAARALGVDEETIKKAIANFESPSGRLEIVVKKPFTVIVDFAHTPQAFVNVLPVARGQVLGSGNKLIHVFGCTGDRDKSKRPIMGQIAQKHDDVIILTHEDTYFENPEKIIAEIKQGIGDWELGINSRYFEVSDRREAIKKALDLARPGDVVILTGVGHQRSMNLGGKEVPWNEPMVVKEEIRKKREKRNSK